MRQLSASLLATVLAGASLLAHHSYNAYVPDQLVSIEGRIENYRYEQPHVTFVLRDAQSRAYLAEWVTMNRLARSGVSRDTLGNGDRVIVTARPTKDASDLRLWVQGVQRPSDGFRWPNE